MIPSLTLPQNCSHFVRITSEDGHLTLFQSCKSRMSPLLFPVQQTGIRIEFSGSGSSTAPGFLMSVLSVSRDLEYILTRVMDKADSDNSMVARLVQTMMEYSKQVRCDLLEVNYQDPSNSGSGTNGKDFLHDDPRSGEEAQIKTLVGGYSSQTKEAVCCGGETKWKLIM